MSKLKSLLVVSISAVAAPIITNAKVGYGAMEFGAIIYWVIPTCVGFISILLFSLLADLLEKYRIILTIILVVINIVTGIAMRLNLLSHVS